VINQVGAPTAMSATETRSAASSQRTPGPGLNRLLRLTKMREARWHSEMDELVREQQCDGRPAQHVRHHGRPSLGIDRLPLLRPASPPLGGISQGRYCARGGHQVRSTAG
jgi:hypothetical protein